MRKTDKHYWQVIYPDNDWPNKLDCGALRLQITPGPEAEANSAKAKLYVFEKQGANFEHKETVSLTGSFVEYGGSDKHGRVTFTLKPSETSTWPYFIKGTYYIGKAKSKGNTDTIVLRFFVRATGRLDGPCDEAPDEDVLEEMALPNGGTNPEIPPDL